MPAHQPATQAVKTKPTPTSAARRAVLQARAPTATMTPQIGACACGGSCETRADELESADKDSAEAKTLRSAITAIAADPQQAANPQYSFLFSVAFMKMPDDSEDRVTGDAKAARGQVTSWMGQQPADAKADKNKAYAKAHEVLMRKFDAQYGYGNEGDPINDDADLGPGDTRVRPRPVRATTITPR